MYKKFIFKLSAPVELKETYSAEIQLCGSGTICSGFVILLVDTELANDEASVANTRACILSSLLSTCEGKSIHHRLPFVSKSFDTDKLTTFISRGILEPLFDNNCFLSKIVSHVGEAYHAKAVNCWLALIGHISDAVSIVPNEVVMDEFSHTLATIENPNAVSNRQKEIINHQLESIQQYALQILREKSVLRSTK